MNRADAIKEAIRRQDKIDDLIEDFTKFRAEHKIMLEELKEYRKKHFGVIR